MTFIMAQGLRRACQIRTGPMRVLDGLNLSIEQGIAQGLPGPNDAGKTTFVKVLAILLRPESGRANVVGIDVLADPAKVCPLVDTPDWYAAVDEVLTARENLMLVGRLYRIGIRQTKRHTEELLEAFDLTEAADRPLKGFSSGMRRHVDLVEALAINPPVLLLDEPTTGLDPQARMGLWEITRERVGEGATVLLTARHLGEASQLVGSIFVIDRGHIITEGIVDEFKASMGGKRIELTLTDEADTDRTRRIVASNTGTEVVVTGRVFTAQVGNSTAALIAVLKVLSEESIELHDTGIHRPTLDNVSLTLVGHTTEKQEVAVRARFRSWDADQ